LLLAATRVTPFLNVLKFVNFFPKVFSAETRLVPTCWNSTL